MSSEERERPRYGVHLGLFLATCLTTTWAGIRYVHPDIGATDFAAMVPVWSAGLPYSSAIMTILLTHEMGHYLLARRHGVDASLPYFLPVPLPLAGTMGAVIAVKGQLPSRNALVDWAAGGPLAGLLVAIPIWMYGIHLSPVGDVGPGLLEGSSVLYFSLKYLVKGELLPGGGKDIAMHPTALAGWLGQLVTMINLMPIGQLDGGHIATAYFGNRHNRGSAWLHRALLPMALLASGYTLWELSRKAALSYELVVAATMAGAPWAIWWGLLKILKRASGGVYHPPVSEEPLTRRRQILCVVMLIVFLLILTPIPMRVTL